MSHPSAAALSLRSALLSSLSSGTPDPLQPLPPTISVSSAPAVAPANVDELISHVAAGVSSPEPLVCEAVAATVLLSSLCLPHSAAASLALPRALLEPAFRAAHRKLKALNGLLGGSAGNVLCGALLPATRDCYKLAVLMDEAFGTGASDHDRLESAVQLMQDTFSKTLNDRSEFPILQTAPEPLSASGSKKCLVLAVVNYLFASYFALNTLRLCKNIQRPVEAKRLHQAVNGLGGKSAMLTYRYYTGRLGMFEDDYDNAEKGLSYAYLNCPPTPAGLANKRRALRYLIPVRMQRGNLPTPALLSEYSLDGQFLDIVTGLRTGDLRLFNEGLRANAHAFIKNGTYLLLEKCKALCYRNLFKRVYLITQRTQLPLAALTTTFRWLGTDVDHDEVECVLANLIFRGFVRGYISHAKRILVLSKKDPFPVSAYAGQ